MRVLLFLLLLLPIGSFRATARKAAKGPWRVVYQRVRARPEVGEDEWGSNDTTTTWQTRRVLQKAAWNVPPDSIRLFLNCDNPLLAPAARSGIRFTATGATLRLDAKQGLVWVFPTASIVVLTAKKGQATLFKHAFQSVPPPLPSIKCFISDPSIIVHDCKSGKDTYPYSITLKAVPANDFATFMPDDARYCVAKYQLTSLRKGAAILPPITVNGGTADLAELGNQAQPNDQLQIDVLLVQHQNARGTVESIPVEQQFVRPLIVKK